MKILTYSLPALFFWTIIIPGVSAQNAALLGPLTPAKSSIPSVNDSQTIVPTSPHNSSVNPPPLSPEYRKFQENKLLEDKGLRELGLIERIYRNQIFIRSSRSRVQGYMFSPLLKSIPKLRRGMLVSYKLKHNKIEKLQIPVVKNIFEGTLIVMEENVLGLLSIVGERKITNLSLDKIDSLNLKLGQTVQVVEFVNIRAKIISSPNGRIQAPIYIGEL